MKKLFTVLLAAVSISVASAQGFGQKDKSIRDSKYGSRNEQVMDFGKGKSNDIYVYSFSAKEKDRQIEKINHEFDLKILMIKRSRHLRGNEKSRKIRMLEHDRYEQIKEVQFRFEKSKGRGNDREHDKKNNRKW